MAVLKDASNDLENYMVVPGVAILADQASQRIARANSGRVHLVPDFTANGTLLLPAGEAGMMYEFCYNGVAADAQNMIITAQAGQFIRGGIISFDEDAGAAGDESIGVFANGSSHLTLTITTPRGGTLIKFFWNGTGWTINGLVVSATTPAFS